MRVYTSLNYISGTGLIPEEALPGLSFYLFGTKRERGGSPTPFHDKMITSFCSYARPAQPGPNRTRLCGPCIVAIAVISSALVRFGN